MLRSSAGNNSLQNDPSKTSVSASKSPSHKAFMGFQLPEEPVEISSSQESTRVISDENTLTNRNKKSRTVRFAASSPNQLGSDFDISDTPRKRNLPHDTGISSGAQTKRQKQILPNIHIPLRPSSTPQSSNSKIQYVSSAQAYNHKSSRERNLAQKKLPIIRIKLNNIQKAEPESLSSSMSPQNLSETSSEINQNSSSFSDSIPSPTVKNNIFNDKGKGKGKTKPRLNNNENGLKFVSQSPSGDDGFSEEEEYEEDSSNTGTTNSQKTKKFFRIGPGMKRTCQNFHIVDPSGRQVYALIASRIDRGFHMGSAGWLTYRRNYITVSSSFSLTTNTRMEYGKVPQCHLYVCNGDSRLLIRSFALRITAFQIFSEDVLEEIPLIQHTPKRNKGFKKPPAIIPAVPGLLPSHNFIQNNTTCRTMSRRIAVENLFTHPRKGLGTFVEYYPECENINHVVVFERIQFTTPSGGESNKCKLVVQLITTLENGVSYVAAWSETPPFSLRIRSPSSYSDSILHMGRSPSKNNQIKGKFGLLFILLIYIEFILQTILLTFFFYPSICKLLSWATKIRSKTSKPREFSGH